MAVLGILLVLCAGAFLADVALTNSLDTHLNMFGSTLSGLTNAWVFLIGAAAGFALALGLAMAVSGLSRRARRRRAHRDALSQQRAETERLAAELERERTARARLADSGTTQVYPQEEAGAYRGTERGAEAGTATGTATGPATGTGTGTGAHDRTVAQEDAGYDGTGRHAATYGTDGAVDGRTDGYPTTDESLSRNSRG